MDEAMIHPDMARFIRTKSGVERLRIASQMHRFARDLRRARITQAHPDWSVEAIERAISEDLIRAATRPADPDVATTA